MSKLLQPDNLDLAMEIIEEHTRLGWQRLLADYERAKASGEVSELSSFEDWCSRLTYAQMI